ncbi:MAG: 50S ribosomal protein L21 [Parcubacteria group bacterium GW2011_GWC2_42_6]|nr:MAG: 50S ribosomal protein L21 [Parcubacteria group bacterium GW2011_GWC2_42_6]KKT76719.1 MAG: 50S ribosomal protein L21 [Parcubacteria group bacterium GW2011_GWF2_44_7]
MEFAIIKTGGKQYKVAPGQKLKIEKIDGALGAEVFFDQVLLVGKGEQADIGKPIISGAKAIGKILKQDRAKKVTVMKYKSKKRYSVKRGHRQPYTLIEITNIENK